MEDNKTASKKDLKSHISIMLCQACDIILGIMNSGTSGFTDKDALFLCTNHPEMMKGLILYSMQSNNPDNMIPKP